MKLDIINAINQEEKQSSLIKKYNGSQSTISIILQNREKYEGVDPKNSDLNRKKLRATVFKNVDDPTFRWLQQERSGNVPISGSLLRAQANKFAEMFEVKDFKASKEWLEKFQSRHGKIFKKICGEKKSAPQEDARAWRETKLLEILEKYAPEDVYNADEAGQ